MSRTFYEGDDRLFRALFKDETGAELTPTVVTVKVVKAGGEIEIADGTPGTISDNEAQFQFNNLPFGFFTIYITADLGAEKPTTTQTFRVLRKDGTTS